MDEIFKNNPYRILEEFMKHPNKDFSIRGLARNLKISHPTILNYIDKFIDLDLVRKKEDSLYPTYYANTESKKLQDYKKEYITIQIKNSGLIEYIKKKTMASVIILFGSCAKGTFHEKSDIDIFVQAEKNNLNLIKFEKELGRTINLLFEKKISDLSNELKNNITNGIVLNGFIRL